jgi:hypothetical protein
LDTKNTSEKQIIILFEKLRKNEKYFKFANKWGGNYYNAKTFRKSHDLGGKNRYFIYGYIITNLLT